MRSQHPSVGKMSLGNEKARLMLETGILSDCQFEIVVPDADSQVLKAHKNQLVYASDVFKEMFLSAEVQEGPIKVTGITPEIFKKLLLYIYTYELELTCGQEAIEVALAAEKYKIVDLKEKCVDFIKLNFNRREIWHIMLLVDSLGDTSLKDNCKVLIMEHAEECLAYEAFLTIPRELLLEILQYDTLNVTSEQTLIKSCVNWCNHNMSPESNLRDEMLPFLPHLRMLSLKCKDFAEGPAQQEWMTNEEKCLIFSYMASSSSANLSQLVCSPLAEPRKKPNFHIYSGVFCVATLNKESVSVPDTEHKYTLSGFQFCLQEKLMSNIYVHNIKTYTVLNNETFKQSVRTSTFKDGQNYLVTLHLAKALQLDPKLSYKFAVKVWRQERTESVYLRPDLENIDLSASKAGFCMLVKCGQLFENTISKIESIIVTIGLKEEAKPVVAENGGINAAVAMALDSSNDDCLPAGDLDLDGVKDRELVLGDSSDDGMEEEETPESPSLLQQGRGPKYEEDSDSSTEEDSDEDDTSELSKVFLSQVDELREIKAPKKEKISLAADAKKHLPHVNGNAQSRPSNGAAENPINKLKRTGGDLNDPQQKTKSPRKRPA